MPAGRPERVGVDERRVEAGGGSDIHDLEGGEMVGPRADRVARRVRRGGDREPLPALLVVAADHELGLVEAGDVRVAVADRQGHGLGGLESPGHLDLGPESRGSHASLRPRRRRGERAHGHGHLRGKGGRRDGYLDPARRDVERDRGIRVRPRRSRGE